MRAKSYKHIRTEVIPRDMWKQVKIKQADHEKIKQMRMDGMTFVAIAKHFKVSPQNIRTIFYGIKNNRRKEPSDKRRATNLKSFARRKFLFEMGYTKPTKVAKIIIATR